MTTIGLIGLGAMGSGMAASLRRAGHRVHVFDVRREVARAFAGEGGVACASPAELGAASDVVISVVVNAAQTESVLFDANACAAHMKPGRVFVMCSTVEPNWSVALEARLEALGLHDINAPISGGAAKAASGQMTMMTDPNLVRVLQAQTKRKVGLLDHTVVGLGPQALRERMAHLRAQGVGVAIVDATSNEDLLRLGPALKDMPLVTAGSGVAIGLPVNWGLAPSSTAAQLPPAQGHQAIISGSCSQATLGQVAHFRAQGLPALGLDPLTLTGQTLIEQVMAWAQPLLGQGPVLIYSTAEPERVKAIQAQLGVMASGELVERALAAIASALAQAGVRQLVVAGGETSGACVQALGITQLQIGPQIDPGVPWCHAQSIAGPMHITLKSGNFGTADFFTKAFAALKPGAMP
jgi:hypothetical protein